MREGQLIYREIIDEEHEEETIIAKTGIDCDRAQIIPKVLGEIKDENDPWLKDTNAMRALVIAFGCMSPECEECEVEINE